MKTEVPWYGLQSERACLTMTFTYKLFYRDKYKIKLEALTLRQGIRNLQISKQKSRTPFVKPDVP